MSDQQQENEITTTQTAPAAPLTSDQAVVPAPSQVSAPEAPKAATPTTPVASEEAAPAKPKRTRRLAKPAADGEDAEKAQASYDAHHAREAPPLPPMLRPPFPMRSRRPVHWRRLARPRLCVPAVALPSARRGID